MLPSNLVAEWNADESNEGKEFPSYARMLAERGTPGGESRYSWTIDFTARRSQARAEIEPIKAEAAELRDKIVDLKERLKRLKKEKAPDSKTEAVRNLISDTEKQARDLDSQASAIDAAVFDLKAVNPNVVAKTDNRTPAEIISSIAAQGQIVTEALMRLRSLMEENPAANVQTI